MTGEITSTTVNNLPRTRRRKGNDGYSNTIRGGDGKILIQE
jgi:hypothetical protein